jgi:hypothetical protein
LGFILPWWAFSGGKPERVLQHAADIASLKAKLAQYPSGTELQLNISGSPQQVALVDGAIEAVASEHRFEIGQPEPIN